MKKILLFLTYGAVLFSSHWIKAQVFSIQTPELQALDDVVLVLPETHPELSILDVQTREDFVPLAVMEPKLRGLKDY